MFPQIVWKMQGGEKTVYLTFDDGPTSELTEYILTELEKYHAQATFFCVGENLQRHYELHTLMKLKGHTIGNHTHNHLNGWQTDSDSYLANIEQAGLYTDSKLFRPPYGKITPAQVKKVSEQGYKIVNWTWLCYDFDSANAHNRVGEMIANQAEGGDIIVLHDNIKHQHGLQIMLPILLRELSQRGFSFKAIA